MEAQKERQEQVQRREGDEGKRCDDLHCSMDPTAKKLLREAITNTGKGARNVDKSNVEAQEPGNVLAFSRSVYKIDSSLE
uniref:Uncharacterized protein n=1 Tax=Nelumbo nucifera TaxID=4432 RepID=A0A822ZR12_NELNU|nr:TPA_asm: hypothetical protein HUJ06_004095 [Nelumbo nucifera]